jgi:hypothetical protein
MAAWRLEAHAIVCREGCIADAAGRFPEALANDADWARFQAALDACAAVVLGRASHEATPNRAGRRRVIVSRAVGGLEARPDGLWWNPAGARLESALEAAAPGGGRIGVPGGRDVFDLLLYRIATFELARHPGVALPGGVPVLSGVGPGRPPEAALAEAGFVRAAVETLDPEAGVLAETWRRVPSGAGPDETGAQ